MDHQIPFMKMHGLGNDFVVIDSRNGIQKISPKLVRALGDRHRGIGFDQLAVISDSPDADVALTFFNKDGSSSETCGNATRCVACYEMERLGIDRLTLITERGILFALYKNNTVSVNMGHPLLAWNQVPLAREMDTLHLPMNGSPTATGMGNPHCTFFVKNVDQVELEAVAPDIENDPLFPQRTNVQFVHKVSKDHLRMRVWERGVGVTLASGSSSCAAAVASARLGLTGHKVQIDLDGGTIYVDWREDGVWMSGDTSHVFNGTLTTQFLKSLT
jgi:diaminopimelate epimerase